MKESAFRRILEAHTPNEIVAQLGPYLTDRRREVIEISLDHRLCSVQVAIEAPHDIHNGLAVIRTAEALGLTDTHIIAPELEEGAGIGTSKGAIRWIQVHRYKGIEEFRPAGLLVAGAALEGEMTLEELPVDRPLVLLFGNEHRGLSPAARERCEILFKIPMYGVSESLNLSVAAAIALYDIAKRRRNLLQRTGDLPEVRKNRERARQYIRTVGVGVSQKLLTCQNSFNGR